MDVLLGILFVAVVTITVLSFTSQKPDSKKE